MRGVRVHRGFQDWGDVDTYEFQLLCAEASYGMASPAISGVDQADTSYEEDNTGVDAYGRPMSGSDYRGRSSVGTADQMKTDDMRTDFAEARENVKHGVKQTKKPRVGEMDELRGSLSKPLATSSGQASQVPDRKKVGTFGARAAEAEEFLKEIKASRKGTGDRSQAAKVRGHTEL